MSDGIERPARRPAGWVAPGPAPAGPGGRDDLRPGPDEDLCFLSGDWRLFQKQRGHRWSLDDLVTAWLAAQVAPDAPTQLDLGCGLGSVLLLSAWRFPGRRVVGLEAQADRAALARRSIAYNGVAERCVVHTGDLREGAAALGRFDLVTGTPPYFPRGTGVESAKPHATPCRFELRGGVEDYLQAAAQVLTEQGTAVVCTGALEEARVRDGAQRAELHLVDHLEVVPRTGKAPLVMVDAFRRAPGPTVRQRSLTVRGPTLQWTDEFRAVRAEFGMPSRPPDR